MRHAVFSLNSTRIPACIPARSLFSVFCNLPICHLWACCLKKFYPVVCEYLEKKSMFVIARDGVPKQTQPFGTGSKSRVSPVRHMLDCGS